MLLLFVTVVTVVQRPASGKRQKAQVKPENTWGFPGIFGYYPHWTLEIVVGHCQAFLIVDSGSQKVQCECEKLYFYTSVTR